MITRPRPRRRVDNVTSSLGVNHSAISVCGVFRAVAAVDEVVLHAQGEVAADRAGGALVPSVGPISVRATATASRPSQTIATVGPLVRKLSSES